MESIRRIVLWRMFQDEIDEREFHVATEQDKSGQVRYSVLLKYVNRSIGEGEGTTIIARNTSLHDAVNIANDGATTLQQYQWAIMDIYHTERA